MVDSHEVVSKLDSPRFNQYLARWRVSGENFLVYAASLDGRHTAFEASRKSDVTDRLGLILGGFAARKRACVFQVFTEPALKELLTDKAEQHLFDSRNFKLPTKTSPSDIEVIRGDHPLYGPVLFAQIPKKILQEKDVASLLQILDSLVAGMDGIQSSWMKLRIAFDGWDEDPRAVFQIPPIKAFLRAAAAAAPWWLALAHPTDYLMWFASIADIQSIGRDSSGGFAVQFQPNALEKASGLAAVEAIHLLACSEMEPGESFDSMAQDLQISVSQLLHGLNASRADPLTVMANRSV